MGNSENKAGQTGSETGANPPAGATTTSTENKKTSYTAEEFETAVQEAGRKAFSDMMAESGRRYKPVEDENKTLKTQMQTITTELTAARAQLEDLNKTIEELSASDPDKKRFMILKRKLDADISDLESQKNNLKAEKDKFTTERTTTTADSLVEQFGVDKEELIKLSGNDPERMKMVVKYLPKATAKPKEAPIIADSGKTQGGSQGLTGKTPRQLIELGIKNRK
jgi:chromosome segregation ATPase